MPDFQKEIVNAVKKFYQNNPNMRPFVDGDRAAQLGMPSAEIFAAGKATIEQYARGDNPTSFHRAGNKNFIGRFLSGSRYPELPEEV